MHIELTVKRRFSPNEAARLQTFLYDGDGNLTVADWLTEVEQFIRNIEKHIEQAVIYYNKYNK